MDTMKLRLELALSSGPVEGVDPDGHVPEPGEFLGSDPFSNINFCSSCESTSCTSESAFLQKQSFEQGVDQAPQTLPLLMLWHTQTNEAGDHQELDKNSSTYKSDGEEEGVVGWPPIKSGRKHLCCQMIRRDQPCNQMPFGCGRSKSRYVKVQMEGVGIARKVDLNLHHSYEALMRALFGMFGKDQRNTKAYQLAFQDPAGDWLLAAADIPWSSFIQSVQRLKLLRSRD